MVYQIISAAVALSLDNIKVWINEKIAEEKAKKMMVEQNCLLVLVMVKLVQISNCRKEINYNMPKLGYIIVKA